jgi:hypothetical protein
MSTTFYLQLSPVLPILEEDMCIFCKKIPVFTLLFLALTASLGALDVQTRNIPDDSSLRRSLVDTWFTEMPGRVLNRTAVIHSLPGVGRIEVRTEQGRDEFMVVLARELRDAPESAGAFPGWAQGSWVLTRRKDDGSPVRIRIFPRSDPYTYIQFRPLSADRCLMDVVLYDAYAVRSLQIPLAFERLYVIPIEEAFSAATVFPRRYFDPSPDLYREKRAFIAALRGRLPELSFRDDGAIDREGRYVFINDESAQEGAGGLNCSGFAKWVVDGMLRPITGERLSIAPLKAPVGERGSSFNEPYEALRDPYFGLDWTRNLAAVAGTVLRAPSFGVLDEIEVRKVPFSSVILRERQGTSIRAYPGFLPEAGFGFEGIHPLLYTLAIDEPDCIYLASINNEIGPAATPSNPRGGVRIRQHYHVAVLVPYFNEYGNFQVAVFESAEETSFNRFKTRYPGQYVNLVRIPVETVFEP